MSDPFLRFDLVRWLKQQGFSPHGKEWRAACPVCGKDEKLTVNATKRVFRCFVCQTRATGASGGVAALVAWWNRWNYAQAVEWLRAETASPAGLIASLDVDLRGQEASLVPRGLRPPPAPEGSAPLTPEHLAYLATRGISVELAQQYRLFSCVSGKYRDRIVFPAWGATGELLYWQARATWSPERDQAVGRRHIKVLNPPAQEGTFTSEHVLFNLWRAARVGRGAIVLCEGPVSAIHAGDDAVAMWGKVLSDHHVAEMRRAGVHTVDVMLDGPTPSEPSGARAEAAGIARRLLHLFFRVRLVVLPSGDPGDYTRAQNQWIRAWGQPVRFRGIEAL